MSGEQMPEVKPLDPPMVPFVLGGMAIWVLAGLVCWLADAPTSWIWICVAGFVVALPGLGLMVVHDRNRRIRRSRDAQTDSTALSS
ncbi:hypothetical protein F4553_004728 [Allocatelliglobosispora scoriae]|uniref:DUF2530 domain-containing protein n=1 Tax=Allocatelliglobosispora scoriae TaxID=643052 RepID=A0A841BW20_9ACTN|nr:DUF2530 domain-containing protein [Allocatelliglobosispora scoriae]MBB5871349.1 hypothetical protein [Allocatelliglobosispora scoriae]